MFLCAQFILVKFSLLSYPKLAFITSAKEVMFLPDFVCLSVCLRVNKITQKVMDGSV